MKNVGIFFQPFRSFWNVHIWDLWKDYLYYWNWRIFMTVTWYLGGVFVEIPIGWYDFIEVFHLPGCCEEMCDRVTLLASVCPFLGLWSWYTRKFWTLWGPTNAVLKELVPTLDFQDGMCFFRLFHMFLLKENDCLWFRTNELNLYRQCDFFPLIFDFGTGSWKLDMTTYKQHLSTYSSVTSFWLVAHLLSIIKAGLI